MDVLSAEEYLEPPTVHFEASISEGSSAQHPIGISVKPSSGHISNAPHTRRKGTQSKQGSRAVARRDRSKVMPDDQASNTRQRGRPRLSARDQSAGERRRTQIRLAQRAYRERKENTISDLNDQVTLLDRTIREMAQTVSAFHDRALASDIEVSAPILAQDLRSIVARFNNIARNTNPDSVPSSATLGSDLSSRVYTLEDSHSGRKAAQLIAARNRVNTFDSSSQPSHEITAASQVWGYQGYEEEPQTEQLGELDLQQGAATFDRIGVSNDLDWITQSTAEKDDLDPEAQSMMPLPRDPLASPSTYSFQESTFARRLARAAYERAYRMFADPRTPKEDLHAMCRFSFCFASAQKIFGWVSSINAKGKDESLELWQAPRLHLGNAGLHYPRQPEHHVPPNWADQAPMGPRRSAKAETPVPDWMSVDQIVEMTGFAGEWFDPNDVEHYLRSKGLQLDGQSSRLEIDDNAVPGLETPQLNASVSPSESYPDIDPPSPVNVESQHMSEPGPQTTEPFWNSSMAQLPTTAFSSLDLSLIEPGANPKMLAWNVHDTMSVNNAAFPARKPTTKKFVDVDKFVDIIANQGMCLGRTPGWRRDTIDSALADAIQEVF